MQAKDVMTANVVSVAPDTDVATVARRLVERAISAVPVVDGDGRVIGIVSEGDLMRRPESETERQPSWWLRLLASPEEQAGAFVKSHGMTAGDVMTRDVVTVAEDTALDAVAEVLERHRIKRVPILRDGALVGIVSRANLLHGLIAGGVKAPAAADDGALRAAVLAALSEAGIRDDFVDVVVSDGVARLWGAVESQAEKRAARVAAESTPGVARVEDHIGIMPRMVRAAMWGE